MEYLMANWESLVVVLVFIAGLLVLLRFGKVDTVRKIVLSLVVQAEKTLGSGTGELKYAYVIDHLYDKLPAIISFLFTKKEIDNMIEDSVKKLKDVLSSGITLTGYDDERYLYTITQSDK